MSRPPVHYAFLVLKEHPYGREMLAQLLAAGFTPAILIEEDSAVADEEREKFYERLAGQPLPPPFAELLAGRGVRREAVPHHNREECERQLREVRPDLIVLGGTRIIRPNIFSQARDGALNSHPGLLPQVRGSASVAWSIYHDIPVGCTCHFIDADIDTGDIVLQRALPVRRGDTYEKLVWDTIVCAGSLMTEALRQYQAGALVRTPQPKEGTTYRVMPPEMVAEVRAKLADGSYKHFADAA
jgi:methionyl-tRNA formyltransferase